MPAGLKAVILTRELLVGEKGKSGNVVAQQVRICKLQKDGKDDEIKSLEANPIVYCQKCRAKSNNPSSLCNPRALKPGKAM